MKNWKLGSLLFVTALAACASIERGPNILPSSTILGQSNTVWAKSKVACSVASSSEVGTLRITDSELVFGNAHEALYWFDWSGFAGSAITRPHDDVTNRAKEKTYTISLSERSGMLTVVDQATKLAEVYQRCTAVDAGKRH